MLKLTDRQHWEGVWGKRSTGKKHGENGALGRGMGEAEHWGEAWGKGSTGKKYWGGWSTGKEYEKNEALGRSMGKSPNLIH